MTALLLLIAGSAHAQIPAYSFAGGTSANLYPWNASPSAGNHVQSLFLPSQFTPTVTGPSTITDIYFKVQTAASNATYTNVQISMGTTSLTSLTSGPWNSGLTPVYSASTLTISSAAAGAWVKFTLTTPFFWNGTSNLIVDCQQSSLSGVGFNVANATVAYNSRLYGVTGSTTSTGADGQLPGFGFDLAPAVPCNGAPTAPVITTAPVTEICMGSTKTLTATNPNFALDLAYQWEESNNQNGPWFNANGGTGATTLNYTTPPVTTDIWYRMKIVCTNTGQSTASAPYRLKPGLPALGNITGPLTFCPGVTQTYTVPALSGASTYGWSLPAGWTGSSTSNTITVTAGNSAGNINVTAYGTCGASPTQQLAVTFANPDPGISIYATSALPVCAGSPIVFNVTTFSAGTAPTYQWFKNGSAITGNNSPTYTVVGPATGDTIMALLTSNSNCVDTNQALSNKVGIQVIQPVMPSVTVSASPGTTNITPGQTVTFTAHPVNAGTAPAYQWKKNGQNIFNATNATYTTNTLVSGDQITVELVSNAPCAAPNIVTSPKVIINPQTGIGTINGSAAFTLAPNPNNGHFTLTGGLDGGNTGKPLQIEVLNTLGQVIYYGEAVPARSNWNVDIRLKEDIAPGLYLLRLRTDGRQSLQRFEITK